jgi:glycosyltransferase involved in cell wall biosynthesis
MNTKPSICFVAPMGHPVLSGNRGLQFVGGAEVQQSLIATKLAERGYPVSMISMDYGQREGDVIRGVRQLTMHSPDAGVPVLRYLHPRLTSLWRAMGRADADVYYQRASGATTGFVAAFAQRHGRVSVFAGAHDADFEPGASLIRYARDRVVYRWGLQHVDRIVVQTERQMQMCRQHHGRSAVRIDSCYAHEGRPASHDGTVLWVANLKRHKRPHLFLELAAALPEYRFRLVGGAAPGAAEADYLRAVQQRAVQLPNVEVMGFVPITEVETQFDGAALFVNTSIGEGFPNTFLQAWSRGMPTVSFFDPQVEFEGAAVGIVVANVEAMQREVRALMSDRARWLAAGERALRTFEVRYSAARTVDAYERLFESVLAEPRSQRFPASQAARG